MPLEPDENDIIYEPYGLDLVGAVRALIEWVGGLFGYGGSGTGVDFGNGGGFLESLSFWWDIFSVIAVLLSALFFAGFIYAKIRLAQLGAIQADMLLESEAAWAHAYGGAVHKNDRWEDIKNHIGSQSPSDWRLGIIEADIFLEEVLRNVGYVGTSIGDMLKSANPVNFTTLQDAWDAHTVRNKIAHEGADFILTKRIANETLVKFERVFREFGAI